MQGNVISHKEMAEGGGFESEFVTEPPSVIQTNCPVCLLVLREPSQVTCCGKSYCRSCIERVKVRKNSCPCCQQRDFIDYPNKGLQQPLYGLQVYCSNKKEGCDWIGELGTLDKHQNLKPSQDEELEGSRSVYQIKVCSMFRICPKKAAPPSSR